LKTGRIIVFTLAESRIDLGLMLHGVTRKKQGKFLRKGLIDATMENENSHPFTY
jgi:hypothetical protein